MAKCDALKATLAQAREVIEAAKQEHQAHKETMGVSGRMRDQTCSVCRSLTALDVGKEAKAKKKKGKSTGNEKAKAAPAKLFPEPTCTGCGCTEGAACEGGCAWVTLDKRTNAGRCSACPRPPKAKKGKKTGKAAHTSAPSRG